MLTSLSIGNFKAFGATQTIPIRPLTLIFGANSSGKSSIIHSLLLANHALAKGNLDVHQPRLAGESVDLGGFREFVHRHHADDHCTLGFKLEHQAYRTSEDFASFTRTTVKLDLGLLDRDSPSPRAPTDAEIVLCAISVDDIELLQTGLGRDGLHHVRKVNFDHPYFAPFFARLNQLRPPESPYRKPGSRWQPPTETRHALENVETIERVPVGEAKGDEVLLELKETLLQVGETIQRNVQTSRDQDAAIRADFFGELRTSLEVAIEEIPLSRQHLIPVSARSLQVRENYAREAEFGDQWRGLNMMDNLEFFEAIETIFGFEIEELLGWIDQTFGKLLESAAYLGPLRSYPPRHLVGMHDGDPNWFSGGGHAWDILRRDPEVVARVNDWFEIVGAGCKLTVRNLTDISRLADAERKTLAHRLQSTQLATEADAAAALDALLQALEGSPTATTGGEVSLLDKSSGTEVTHRDVGVGISQVLPVLVHAIADRNQIVAIEQPEIHLHPALQAELGDVFIESALGERKNTFLLETHSEHLILRIMRRIRETHLGKLPKEKNLPPVRPSDVAVLYVEKEGTRSIVREFPLNERGELVKAWPGGFFEEDLREVLG